MKHLPNILSVIRLILVPIFVFVFFSGDPNAHTIALGIYVLASITDVLDGYIARRYNLVTELGTVLDPLADKLMLIAAMTCIYLEGNVPLIVLGLVIAKESFQILAGFYLYWRKTKVVIPANKFGKLGTILFFLSIVLILSEVEVWIYSLVVLGAVLVSVLALISYSKHYFANHHKSDEKG